MLTIGKVAARTGLRASAIRYYEAQGLVPTASRKGGKRIYDASILERLAVIELGKKAGFELREIRGLLIGAGQGRPAPIWRKLADAKRSDLDDQMSRLATMKDVLAALAACGCATLVDCGRAFNAARPLLPLEPPALRRSSARGLRHRG